MEGRSIPSQGAGQAPGLEVWRIENMRAVKVANEAHGVFFTGDSYIVLHTSAGDGRKSYSIHFWLGASSSQDESGAASILAVDLDDSLGGIAKQYRQVQGGETPEFIELFGGRLRYREGGVASGFRHVEPAAPAEPILLHIQGERCVRVVEVPLSLNSLSSSDVFVLDNHSNCFLWTGRAASTLEKAKAQELLAAMKQSRAGKLQVKVVEEGSTDDAAAEFYSALGASDPSSVKVKTIKRDATESPPAEASEPRLYKIKDAKGVAALDEIKEQPLRKSLLQTSSAYALAAGGWLFIWQGAAGATPKKRTSMALARNLLQQLQLPIATPVQLVKEGQEDQDFKQHFDWLSPMTPSGAGSRANRRLAGSTTTSEGASSSPELSPSQAARPAFGALEMPEATTERESKEEPPSQNSEQDGHSTPQLSKEAELPAKAAGATEDGGPIGSEIVPDTKTGPLNEVSKAEPAAATEATGGLANGRGDELGSSQNEGPASPVQKPAEGLKGLEAQVHEEALTKPSALSKTFLKDKDTGYIPMPQSPEPVAALKPATDLKFLPEKDTFPYDELKDMRVESGIDMTRKEDYLSSDDFKQVFGKSQSEFRQQPKWRQLQAKKDVGLF